MISFVPSSLGRGLTRRESTMCYIITLNWVRGIFEKTLVFTLPLWVLRLYHGGFQLPTLVVEVEIGRQGSERLYIIKQIVGIIEKTLVFTSPLWVLGLYHEDFQLPTLVVEVEIGRQGSERLYIIKQIVGIIV